MNDQCNNFFAFICLTLIIPILGHGYLSDPPSRSAAWRYGFDTERNFNDNEVTCGRVELEKCGVCGDPLSENPGANTLGGKYGSGTIVKTYGMGKVIKTRSKITANHAGWFEFSLCEIRNNQPATETCFTPLVSMSVDRRPKDVDRPETKWELLMADGLGEFDVDLQLPAGFTCRHCVLRWFWNCGNDYYCDKNGKCGLGGGPKQEKFYSCADIAITATGNPDPTKKPTTTTTTRTTTTRRRTTTTTTPRRTTTTTTTMRTNPTTTTTTTTTTRKPVTTTTTKHRPVTTITRRPVTTTTKRKPITTTPRPFTTTRRPVTTTRKSVTTTHPQFVTTTSIRTTEGRTSSRNEFMTTPANKRTACTGAKHGALVADPNDCCGFVYCLWPSSIWEKEINILCPHATAWQVKGYCDYAERVNCGHRNANCLR